MGRRYTEKEDELILELTARGAKLKEIAALLGRSAKSVKDRRWYVKKHGRDQLRENDTLCWICRHATNPENKCPWTGVDERERPRFEEVPGWTAEARKIRYLSAGKPHEYSSYIVRTCPLFKRG